MVTVTVPDSTPQSALTGARGGGLSGACSGSGVW